MECVLCSYTSWLKLVKLLFIYMIRMPQRRRSSRLNQGSCEIRGVSQNTLHENPVVPVAPSTLSLEKQYGQTTGKHMVRLSYVLLL
jgi:hypothetical protein